MCCPAAILLVALAADGPQTGAVAPGALPAVVNSQPRPGANPAASDRRDIVVLLDQGPVLIRLHVALGGVSLAEARRAYVHRLVTSLDANKDGKLSRDEANRSPLFRTKSRPSANAFLDSLRAQASLTPRDVEQRVEEKVGQIMAYRDDPSSSQNDLEVFKLLDVDKSGVLETAELVGAEALILVKDDDGDDCVSFQEFFPPPPPPDPMAVAAGLAEEPEVPQIKVSDVIRNIDEPRLPQRLMLKYDKSPRDNVLSSAELSWPAQRCKLLDGNGDGKLNAEELALLPELTPDLELTVDLAAPGLEGGLIQVESSAGKRLDDGGRPDYAKVGLAAGIMTFSHRNVDPVAASIADAMRKFNTLDTDANGYLDKDETKDSVRFQRELFEKIDVDGDGKIFADEMKQFVTAFCEPAASSCRMHLYDTGYGFFMALDGNADGRVSRRERMNAAAALASLDRDGKLGIAEKEPVRHFHIEFVRGGFQLFGASEQLAAPTPAFQQRKPTGPIWFQRMDKNNDGDLVWNEFLGHIETFHALDTDGNDLLDPQEAAKYKPPAATSNDQGPSIKSQTNSNRQ